MKLRGASLACVAAIPLAQGFLASTGVELRAPAPPLRVDAVEVERSTSLDESKDSFTLAVLGDLHLDGDDMELHEKAREEIIELQGAEQFLLDTPNCHLVSLGDLGCYGEAGTTKSLSLAKSYLDGFGVDYSLVTGNHDLEGMNEFDTDEANLAAWQEMFGRETPQFCTQIAKKTLCVGLSTTRFRDAQFSSHEVHIDHKQLAWFEQVLEEHPAEEGWKVLVFTHAPPLGSGLRVLQGVHLKNGCAWLNHTGTQDERRAFLRCCKKHKCIKAWFSGHFHLSHDFEDSINVQSGVCFVQTGVIGAKSSRDGRRQSRMVRGLEDGLEIFTVSHHRGGDEMRLDITLKYDNPNKPVWAHGSQDYDHSQWFSAFTPSENDGCYLQSEDGFVTAGKDAPKAVCWWHMIDGRVLGVHDGMVVEYDAELLSPLGVVVDTEELHGREVIVVEGGKALMLAPWDLEEGGESLSSDVQVIHPQRDGSYWRRFQRNKFIRNQEKQREAMAREWLAKSRQQ